jgi:co-chaperonin GroES (HSP10)
MRTNWEPHQHRILVEVDPAEEKVGSIILTQETVTREQNQQVMATVLKIGPTAEVDENIIYEGARVLIAKWGGSNIPGEGNERLKVINDEDINAVEMRGEL